MLPPGNHVLCAVTGMPIALPDLRYWSAEPAGGLCLSCEIATRRLPSVSIQSDRCRNHG